MSEEEEEKINQSTNDGQSSTENNSTDGETPIMNKEQQTENLPVGQSVLKLQTKAMELHHHPNVEKKNLKEYFLEFLMIFLAVTMGFVAENIREHFSETKIAQQNLEAYRNDLLQHERYFKETIADFNKVLPVYDSIISIFYERKENKVLPVLSRLLLHGQLNYVVTINTPTYNQLISSGSLRFIDNNELKASMANYQDQINSYINYNDRIVNTINNQLGEIGKLEDLHDFWNREKMGNFQSYIPVMKPFALSDEQRNFIIAYNKVFSLQFQAGVSQINNLLKSNAALLKLLDKELNN